MATLPVQAAVPTPQQLYYPQQTQQIYAYTPPQQATVSALQAAQGGAAAAESSVAGPAQATQLAERNSEGGELDDRTVQRGPVAGNSWIRGRVQQLAENVGGEDPAPDTYDSPGQYVSYTVQPNYPAPPLASEIQFLFLLSVLIMCTLRLNVCSESW